MSDNPSLTPEALDTIEARANAATEGPWVVNDLRGAEDGNRDCIWVDARPSLDFSAPGTYRTVAELGEAEGLRPVWTIEDAEFIAHAREDIPTLVVELRRLRTENEEQAAEIEDTATELSNLSEGSVRLFDEQAANIRALQAKIDAGLKALDRRKLKFFDTVAIRAALTGEATT